MSFIVFQRPYRFFLIAAALALLLCLLPISADDAPEIEMHAQEPLTGGSADEVPAGADLSARTGDGCMLHETLFYAPCGHSIQRRDRLPSGLVGLTRAALESEIGDVIPGAAVTGFSEEEIDAARSLDIPCPLHWVLRAGEDGMLHVFQNRTGEALSLVRGTDVALQRAGENQRQELLDGIVFDDVQALEGYLESLSS